MSSLYEQLLIKKHSNSAEIEVHLFENCNMACAFCCQDHKDEGLTPEGYATKLAMVLSFIEAKEKNWDSFSVNLMGGELFQDSLGDDYYENYHNFIVAIAEKLAGKRASFCITTNLVFQKCERVWALIKGLNESGINLRLATSYDFVARGWTPVQKGYFVKNLDIFKEALDSVSITLHALSIRKMVSEKDPLFEDLYKRFEVNFDWYIPDLKNDRLFHPSDKECKEALIFLAKNYPECHPVKDYVQNGLNKIQCCSNSRIIVSANNKYSNCQYMDYEQKNFKTPLNRHSTVGMFEKFSTEQGCLACEHFDRCGFYCWVSADYLHRKKDTESCFLSEFFDEVLK